MTSVLNMGCALSHEVEEKGGSRQAGGKFLNTEIKYETSLAKFAEISRAYLCAKRLAARPVGNLPVYPISSGQLETLKGPVIFRLGHSSVLIKLDEAFFLTDPVFSERASPVQWFGPKRFHEVPIAVESLPKLKAVVISHDHYDHLDKASIQQLNEKTDWFVTPLKVGSKLIDWGIDPEKVIEKDWWQAVQLDSVTLVATPAQHFSGRGLFDKNETLWASWVLQGEQANLFFSGDSGYFSGFKQIGERYGPFDVTMIETGAYNEMWSEIHMRPEESVRAHLDLQGRMMMPIHNGTFDLALHDWHEPFERVVIAAKQSDVTLLLPEMGQQVDISSPEHYAQWWSVSKAEFIVAQ